MSPQRKRDSEPSRRSGRLLKPPSTEGSKAKKQKKSEDNSEQKVKMLFRTLDNGRNVEICCWICHKPADEKICFSCPRVYHYQCLKSTSNEFSSDICPECLSESVDGTEFPASIPQQELLSTLQYIMIRTFLLPIEVLNHWPSEYGVCHAMDFESLTDHIKNARYSNTGEFYRDVQWIYHNCYTVLGANDNTTTTACKIVKAIKNELLHLELCFECYNNGTSAKLDDRTAFITLCKKPHRLLWVKLKGYPYWPSKCLKVINGMAHVQFFGTHDRTAVKANTCFLMSKKNPSGKSMQRAAYQNAEDEMMAYIKNYEEKYGPYKYAAAKTVFVPSDDECCVVKKRLQPSYSLNVSLSSEAENENLHCDESGRDSSQDIEIIDDVEIAEPENYGLYETCDIIDIPDEDETINIINFLDNGNSSENQGVETSTAAPQDGVAPFQEGFDSPPFELQMPSPMVQNSSTIFQPSIIGISSSSNLQEDRPLSALVAEFFSAVHRSNEPREEVEFCYVKSRTKASMINTRTDLTTLSHDFIRNGIWEGEQNMKDLHADFPANVIQYAQFPKVVNKNMARIREAEAKLLVKWDEVKRLEQLYESPNPERIKCNVYEKSRQQLRYKIQKEIASNREKKFQLYKKWCLKRKEHADYWNASVKNKKFVDQGTSTEEHYAASLYTAESIEEEKQEKHRQMKLEHEQKVLAYKANTYCNFCLNIATYHCCMKANYCEKACEQKDIQKHAPVCENPKKKAKAQH